MQDLVFNGVWHIFPDYNADNIQVFTTEGIAMNINIAPQKFITVAEMMNMTP